MGVTRTKQIVIINLTFQKKKTCSLFHRKKPWRRRWFFSSHRKLLSRLLIVVSSSLFTRVPTGLCRSLFLLTFSLDLYVFHIYSTKSLSFQYFLASQLEVNKNLPYYLILTMSMFQRKDVAFILKIVPLFISLLTGTGTPYDGFI